MIEQHEVEGKSVLGVVWTGRNFYTIKQLVGEQVLGMLRSHGSDLCFGTIVDDVPVVTHTARVGDTVWADTTLDDIQYTPEHGLFHNKPTSIGVISNG